MNKSTNKHLNYNRFRAYLRVRLKNKSFSKTRLLLIIAIYILFSLTIFWLPLDVLTQYPLLQYFTDFMDFIPAIKQMEIKTFAPEMCKLYISYMFVVAFVCFWFLLRELFVYMTKFSLYPNKRHKKFILKIAAKTKRYIFGITIMIAGYLLYLYIFLSGWSIGHSRYRRSDEYFIYNLYEMLHYSVWQVGLVFIVGTVLVSVIFMYIDIYKYHLKKGGNNAQERK